ncbi:hypothetical protein DFH28DRAFT_882731 [Melampsora americana]|nr:hypothetical protein DFH28DRAFT_882731 [Melampsora americana]
MSHLDQQHKDYLKPKMGELMKRGAKASVLLLISNLLEYPSALESWGSLSKDKMLVQAELLSQALMGKYFPVKDNGDICLKIFDNMSNNWIREYTRDVLLNTDTRVLPCFETKLKKFIHFCDKITYSYKDMGITVGEALAGFHIGLNQDRLLDLFEMMEAAGAQWYQRAKTWTIRKWPKSLKSELLGKHDLIKQFFDLRDEKMQGLDTQIEKWKREH